MDTARDKSKIPLLTSTNKYFLPQHSFSILPSSIPKLISPVVVLSKNSRTLAEAPPKSSSLQLPLPQEEMAVNFIVPQVNLFSSSFFYCNPFSFCKSIYLVFSHFFFLSSNLQTSGFE